MRYAQKKQTLPIRACRLGDDSPMERELIDRGTLRRLGDGTYEVFSQEAKDGLGEIALPGDYVKADSDGHPYPNSAAFFESKHVRVAENTYTQITQPLPVWLAEDPPSDAIAYLLRTGKLQIDEASEDQYFRAELWGAPLSAARDAVVVFYAIRRDEQGGIIDVDFNFVVRDEFDRTYEWCAGPAGA